MSTFTPTQWTLEPPNVPDQLAQAVMQSMSRPIGKKRPWGPLKSLVLGGLSFGLLPLISWPRHFANFVVSEQRQFWHLVEWLRLRGGEKDTDKLVNSVRDTGPMGTIWLVPLVIFAVLAMNFLPWSGQQWGWLPNIFRSTYQLHRTWWQSAWAPAMPSHLYRVWTICLGVAYVSHWLHVKQHIGDVKRMLWRINPILARHGQEPLSIIQAGVGLRPLWVAAAVIGAMWGAWWAIPAALAGSAHYHYTMSTSLSIRSELARRVHAMLLEHRPPMDVPTPHRFRAVCRNELCGKAIASEAAFCPRCGTPVTRSVDAVA